MKNSRYYEVLGEILLEMTREQIQDYQNGIDLFLEYAAKDDFWTIIDIVRKKLDRKKIVTIKKPASKEEIDSLLDKMHEFVFNKEEIALIDSLENSYQREYFAEQMVDSAQRNTKAELHLRAFRLLGSKRFESNYTELKNMLSDEFRNFELDAPSYLIDMTKQFVLFDLLSIPYIFTAYSQGNTLISRKAKVTCTIETGDRLTLDIYKNTSIRQIIEALTKDKVLIGFIKKFKTFVKDFSLSGRQKTRYYETLKIEFEKNRGKKISDIYIESFDRTKGMDATLTDEIDRKAIEALKKLYKRNRK